MADTWQAISGYASNNYSDTMVFEVDGATKQLQKISGQTLIAGEKNSQYIRFMMPRYWDGIDVSEKGISIIYGLAGQYYGETAAISAERTDDSLRFGWVVPEEACCIAGTLLFVLVIKDSSYVLKSQITEVPVLKSINLDDVIPEPTKETWYRDFQARVEQTLSAAENAVEEAQSTLEQARSLIGSPLVANIAEEMTDTSRIYVYTGSETGYTNGHWYYHNGSAWTDGGVYNAVAVDTDTTLSISGKAADAKKTGDEISQIKEDFTDIINSAYVTDSTSGGVAHFEDGADGVPMKSLKVNIEPVQSGSGDPSPSNIRAISGWDAVQVTRSGKNLCNILDSTAVVNGITYTASNGVLTVDGTATANVYKGTVSIPLKAGTYTATNTEKTDDANAYILVSDTSTTPSSWIALANLSDGEDHTFTLDHDIVAAVRVVVRNGKTVSNQVFKPMLVYGSVAPTEFEPYTGNTYDISLASAGAVYGGTLDVVSGELRVTHGYIASYSGETLPSAWISDRDVYAEGTSPTTGAQVVYQLATPLTYDLTPAEIKSLLGINNIWSDAGDVEVEYRADTKLYISRLTDSDTDMIADANIVSGQYFMVGNSLYKATANIASGSAVIVGTNCTRKSLSDALNEINA